MTAQSSRSGLSSKPLPPLSYNPLIQFHEILTAIPSLTNKDIQSFLSCYNPEQVQQCEQLVQRFANAFIYECRMLIEKEQADKVKRSEDSENKDSECSPYYDYRDIMRIFRITKQTVYVWVKNKKIPAFYAGNSLRFPKDQIDTIHLKNKRYGL